jgi:hypothetical protein
MLRRVALVRTDDSEKRCTSFIMVTRIDELRTTLDVTSIVPSSPILFTLRKETLISSDTSVLTRSTRRKIPKYTILHSHRHENLNSSIKIDVTSRPNRFLQKFYWRFTCITTEVKCSTKISDNIVTYTGYVCVVVWLITIRGFGLDTGFIHYGELLYRLQL